MRAAAPGKAAIGAVLPRSIELDDIKALVAHVEKGRRVRRDDFDPSKLCSDVQEAVNWLCGNQALDRSPAASTIAGFGEKVEIAADRLLRLLAPEKALDHSEPQSVLWQAMLEHLPPFEGAPARDRPLETDPAASPRGLLEGLARLRVVSKRLGTARKRPGAGLGMEHFVGWFLADIYIRHFDGIVGTGIGPFTRFASVIVNDLGPRQTRQYAESTFASYVKDMRSNVAPRERRSNRAKKSVGATLKKK